MLQITVFILRFSALLDLQLFVDFLHLLFRVQTTDPQIMEYGVDYVRVIGIMSFGLFIQLTCEKLLQSTGKTIYSMATQLLGAIINIILDPIMIFGLFGFQEWK